MNKKDSDLIKRIFKDLESSLAVLGDLEIRHVKKPSLFYGPWVVACHHSPGATSIYGSGNTPQEAAVDALHHKTGTEAPPF